MTKESFMLVSLNEDKAKKLAQVLSNPTATRILDLLTTGESTESEISKKLKIPLSTVHYNLQQLVQAKLVISEEFHYSPKGREVNHYKLANKYIIIAPNEDETLWHRLKGIMPAALVTIALGVALKATQFLTRTGSTASVDTLAAPAAMKMVAQQEAIVEGAQLAMDTSADQAMALRVAEPVINETVNNTVTQQPVVHVQPWWQSSTIDWIIIGALAVIVLLFVTETIRYYKNKK